MKMGKKAGVSSQSSWGGRKKKSDGFRSIIPLKTLKASSEASAFQREEVELMKPFLIWYVTEVFSSWLISALRVGALASITYSRCGRTMSQYSQIKADIDSSVKDRPLCSALPRWKSRQRVGNKLSTHCPTKRSNKWRCSQHVSCDQTPIPCVPVTASPGLKPKGRAGM